MRNEQANRLRCVRQAASSSGCVDRPAVCRYKGYAVLVEALRHVDATAIIVGDGPLRDNLLTQARKLGVADRLILAGTLRATT